jgi:uridine kinase
MIGDRLVIKDKHRRAAEEIANRLLPEIQRHSGIYRITLAGESGSGKSETGQALAEHLNRRGFETLVLQQDDYFVLPPKTHDRARRRDIGRVGMQEVRLDLLDEHLLRAGSGAGSIHKPLVVYAEDRISEETVSLEATAVVVAEGTYTTALENADARVFIDLSYLETLHSRLERAREAQDDFLEKVLAIEHEIISAQKSRADLIIDKNYRLRPA